MRLKQITDNGNAAIINRHEVASHRNYDNSSWLTANNADSRNLYNNIVSTDSSQFISNCNLYDSRESSNTLESGTTIETLQRDDSNANTVCNRQYKLNTQNNVNFLKSFISTQTANLEGATETVFAPRESFLGSCH